MRHIDTIIVHHSDSPQGRGDDASVIHRWHTEGGVYDGIAYHAVILEDGTIQAGRPDYWTGAHARGNNDNSLGVCLIGKDEFTYEQFDALYYYLEDKIATYDILVDNIIPHSAVSDKNCPGFDLEEFLVEYGLKDI